jgi:hypothetical protein
MEKKKTQKELIGNLSLDQWTWIVRKTLHGVSGLLNKDDILSIRSEAIYRYLEKIENNKKTTPTWCIIDAVRSYCGKNGDKINLGTSPKTITNFDFYNNDMNYLEEHKIDVEDTIDHFCDLYGSEQTGKLLKHVIFDKTTYKDASVLAGYHSVDDMLNDMRRFRSKLMHHRDKI